MFTSTGKANLTAMVDIRWLGKDHLFKFFKSRRNVGPRYSEVVECLPSMLKGLGSIPKGAKSKNTGEAGTPALLMLIPQGNGYCVMSNGKKRLGPPFNLVLGWLYVLWKVVGVPGTWPMLFPPFPHWSPPGLPTPVTRTVVRMGSKAGHTERKK